MAVSTIPAVKAALKTGLAARTGLTGVLVEWGVPHERWEGTSGEWLVLGDTRAPQEAAALGRLRRTENLTIEVYVDVRRQTTDAQSTTERAFVIAGELEDYLRSDPSLSADYGGSGEIVAAQFGGVVRELSSSADRQRRAVLVSEVNVQARI